MSSSSVIPHEIINWLKEFNENEKQPLITEDIKKDFILLHKLYLISSSRTLMQEDIMNECENGLTYSPLLIYFLSDPYSLHPKLLVQLFLHHQYHDVICDEMKRHICDEDQEEEKEKEQQQEQYVLPSSEEGKKEKEEKQNDNNNNNNNKYKQDINNILDQFMNQGVIYNLFLQMNESNKIKIMKTIPLLKNFLSNREDAHTNSIKDSFYFDEFKIMLADDRVMKYIDCFISVFYDEIKPYLIKVIYFASHFKRISVLSFLNKIYNKFPSEKYFTLLFKKSLLKKENDKDLNEHFWNCIKELFNNFEPTMIMNYQMCSFYNFMDVIFCSIDWQNLFLHFVPYLKQMKQEICDHTHKKFNDKYSWVENNFNQLK